MTILLCIALGLSVLILTLATVIEAGGIRQQVSGANGFILFVALYVSVAGSLVLAVVALFAWGLPEALALLAASALWHWGAFHLTTGGLQRMANRVRAERDTR